MSGAASFEYLMGLHAAPLLAGPKPASLVSFRKSKFDLYTACTQNFCRKLEEGMRFSEILQAG